MSITSDFSQSGDTWVWTSGGLMNSVFSGMRLTSLISLKMSLSELITLVIRALLTPLTGYQEQVRAFK